MFQNPLAVLSGSPACLLAHFGDGASWTLSPSMQEGNPEVHSKRREGLESLKLVALD